MPQENSQRMHEYQILLENVYIQLLVDKPWKRSDSAQNPYLLHTHVFAELFVCESGEITLETVNGDIILHPGDAAVVPPKVPHIRQSGGAPYSGATVGFVCRPKNNHVHTELYRRLKRLTTGADILIFRNTPYVFSTVQKISGSAAKKEYLLPVVYLSELLLKLLDEENEEFAAVPRLSEDSSEPGQSAQNLLRMRELDSLIDNEYAKKLNTADIAQRLYISPRQLDRIAVKRYGKTLHQVIADKRINAAVNLLVTSKMTVEAIAAEVGFNSSVGFYREFVKRYGVTPAEYRKAVISGSL